MGRRHRKNQQPIKPPSLPPPPSMWRRLPAAIWWSVGAFAIFATLLQAYPWLAIEQGSLLNPSNPYSELFVVSNQGYIPLAHVDAACVVNYDSPNSHFRNSGTRFPNFAGYLSHGSSATVPCFMTLDTNQVPTGARLDVMISYALYPLDFRRHIQVFHFVNIIGIDGQPHWIIYAP